MYEKQEKPEILGPLFFFLLSKLNCSSGRRKSGEVTTATKEEKRKVWEWKVLHGYLFFLFASTPNNTFFFLSFRCRRPTKKNPWKWKKSAEGATPGFSPLFSGKRRRRRKKKRRRRLPFSKIKPRWILFVRKRAFLSPPPFLFLFPPFCFFFRVDRKRSWSYDGTANTCGVVRHT